VADLASAAPNFPQAAYSGLQKSLQQEWQFVQCQRVTKNIGPEFEAVEVALSRTFLSTLFGDDYDDDDPRRNISCLPVKWAGVAIPNPHSQPTPIMKRALCSALIFWPPFEASTPFNRQNTS
jgi:hypothetical protein